jgi:Na+/proline symporter
MRLVTAIDAIFKRFGKVNGQIYNVLTIATSFFAGSIWLVGLSIILSTVFDLPQIPVIIATGATVVLMSVQGGNWAVVASDFVQTILLISVSIVAGVLTVVELGGIDEFISVIPETHFTFFHPIDGETKYDWLFIASGVVTVLFVKNNINAASKYIAAKDGNHARWAAIVPLVGYIALPVFWFIPPLAAHAIVPNLLQDYSSFGNPGEASYIAVCIEILPQGLLGLMVAGLFAASMSSMDTALNKNAGFIVKNFYQPVLRPKASDKELHTAGMVATLINGLLIIIISLILASGGKLSLFDAYLYLAAYIQMPMAIPLFLGMIMRKTPSWAPWATIIFGVSLGVLIMDVFPSQWGKELMSPLMGDSIYAYLSKNTFTMGNLIMIPGISLFFWATTCFYKENPEQDRATADFFTTMNTPVDFEKEVGGDNTDLQAKLIGWLSIAYGGTVFLLLAVPNPMAGRLGILMVAMIMFAIGGSLVLYSKRVAKAKVVLAEV